jgi:uncharacterized protein
MNLSVEVVFAEPSRQIVKTYRVQAPATVADVLALAAVDAEFAGVDCLHAPVGIYGRLAAHRDALADGDRIEIYRPLSVDPKAARRSRARRDR